MHVRVGLVLCALPAMLMSPCATSLRSKGNALSGETVWEQSSVARRRCAERTELLYPFRCNVVDVGVGGGSCRLVLQGRAAIDFLGSRCLTE